VHTPGELDPTLGAGARLLGVNNRDLRNFEVHIETSLDLIEAIPDECIAVSESGLQSHADLARLRGAGFDAFLIGEHLMKDGDAAQAFCALREAPAAGRTAP
jgi:indole-3-glycerol phosphate synthase